MATYACVGSGPYHQQLLDGMLISVRNSFLEVGVVEEIAKTSRIQRSHSAPVSLARAGHASGAEPNDAQDDKMDTSTGVWPGGNASRRWTVALPQAPLSVAAGIPAIESELEAPASPREVAGAWPATPEGTSLGPIKKCWIKEVCLSVCNGQISSARF